MGIIPKEQLANVRRWQINAFDQPAASSPTKAPVAEPVAAEAPPPPAPALELPTAESIARIEEEARQNGHQAGYEAGYAAGIAAAEQRIAEATTAQREQLLAIAGHLHEALADFDQSVADQLLDLGTEIASQVIRGALSVKGEFLLPVIREAIATLPMHHGHVTLRLNPEDAATLRSQHGEQFAQSGVQIVEDSEVAPGGCLVRAGTSEVDATIETRWKRVLEAIGASPRQWLNP